MQRREFVGLMGMAAAAAPARASEQLTAPADVQASSVTVMNGTSVKDFFAIGDGASHPLSSVTSLPNGQSTAGWTLSQWQSIFPRATSLSQEIDFLAHDKALQATNLVYAPPGTYRFGQDTLYFPGRDGVQLYGAGRDSTFWVTSNATAHVFVFSPNSAQSGQGLCDGNVYSTVQKTAGSAVLFPGGHNYFSYGMVFGINLYNAYRLQADSAINPQFIVTLRDFEINSGQYGIIVGDRAYPQNVVQNVWIESGLIYNQTVAGVLLSNVSGFYLDKVDIGSCNVGINIAPSSSQLVAAGWISKTGGDTCSSWGISCWQPGGLVTEIKFDQIWCSNCGNGSPAGGVIMDGVQIRDITFTSPHVDHCGGSGFVIHQTDGVKIVNPQVFSNSQTAAANYHGIYFSQAVGFSVIGGKSGKGGLYNVNSQAYGIFVDGGCSSYSIIGVDIRGNSTGGILNSGTSGTVSALIT